MPFEPTEPEEQVCATRSRLRIEKIERRIQKWKSMGFYACIRSVDLRIMATIKHY